MKSKIFITLLFLGTSYYVLGTAAVSTAQAVSAGLGLSASIMDIEVPAGGSIDAGITVFNNSTSTALPVHVDLVLWNLKEDADDIEFIRAEESLNATKWFDLQQTDFILEPNANRRIEFTIDPPASVSPGSYFVMMRFQPTFPEFYFEEEGPRFIPEIGTLFFLKVPILSVDGERGLYNAEIVSLTPTGANEISIISNFLPEANAGAFDSSVKTLIARIANTGLFHFQASGLVEVKNIFGRTVAKADLQQRYLLPNRARNLDTIILPPPDTKSLPFLSRTFKKLSYRLKNNTYFGPYSAIVTLSIPGEVPVVSSIKFWIIPWQFWLIAGLGITAIIFIIRRGRGRFSTALKILLGRNRKLEMDDK